MFGLRARILTGCVLWCMSVPSVLGQNVDISELEIRSDPWEGFNRKVYAFNDAFDRYLFLPVATGYRFITPDPVDRGVTNFFKNILMPVTIVNDVLQLKWRAAGSDVSRFFLNSTVGVFGFIDVASRVGLDEQREDFGQTLGYWGVKPGPYVVLPFLGGYTVRDGLSLLADYALSVASSIDDVALRNSLIALDAVDMRADLIPAEQLISGDRYVFLRDAYLQQRRYLIADGEVVDDFGDELLEDFDDLGGFDDDPGADMLPGDAPEAGAGDPFE